MKGDVLIKDSLVLLRQTRVEIDDLLETGLPARIDEVISLLEQARRSGGCDQRMIREALKTLGRGLALLPTISKLISWLKE